MDKIGKTDKLTESKELNLTDTENDFLDLMHEELSNNVGFKPKLRNYIKYKQNINSLKLCNLQHNKITKVFTSPVKDGHIAPTHRNWTLCQETIS